MLISLLLSLVTLLVSSQQEYDALPERLQTALSKGPEEVRIVFSPGTYRFRDDHIHLYGQKYPGTRLVFEGNGAILTGTAPVIQYGPFYRMDRYVEVLDESAKRCRIRTRKRFDAPGQLYVQVTSWYRSFLAPVERVDGRSIYFTLEQLQRSGTMYNVNGDISFGKQRPRYRLVRIQQPSGPVSTAAFQFTDCAFRSLVLSGFTFENNTGGRTEYAKDCLIRFYKDTFGEAVVTDCTFRSVQSDAVRIAYTDGVEIRNCHFEDCFRKGVLSYNHSGRTRVSDCSFERMDLALENSPCVQCEGTDYRVTGNRFVDFGNCAIRLGVHFTEEMKKPSSGIVSQNVISQSDGYRSEAPMNLLMDTGAIYVATQNTSLEIRDNQIHDIDGPYANRGIFCDDGTVNVKILNNRVLRIMNSYCIDLRRVASVEKDPLSYVKQANVGNRLAGNTVDGKVRFENRD